MGTYFYVAISDRDFERLMGVPEGSKAAYKAAEDAWYDATVALDIEMRHLDPSGSEEDVWADYDRRNAAITEARRAALAPIQAVAMEPGKVTGAAWSIIERIMGRKDDIYCGGTTSVDQMLCLLKAQRTKYDDLEDQFVRGEHRGYIGGDDFDWFDHRIRYRRFIDKLMLAVGDGRVTSISWG